MMSGATEGVESRILTKLGNRRDLRKILIRLRMLSSYIDRSWLGGKSLIHEVLDACLLLLLCSSSN
jgi:hypothetical protein